MKPLSYSLVYAADPKVRVMASSGGACKALLAVLIDLGKIDGALITRADGIKAEAFVATSSPEILTQRTNSVYQSSPVLSRLGELEMGKRYAVVALPCQCERIKDRQSGCIRLLISLFCNHCPGRKWLERVVADEGYTLEDVAALRYRGGGWTGTAKMELKNGDSVKMQWVSLWKRYAGEAFRIPPACRICERHTGQEHADLSMGDPWGFVSPDKDSKGKTLVIVNTDAGRGYLKRAESVGAIVVEPLNYAMAERIIASQVVSVRRKRGQCNYGQTICGEQS